MDESTKRKAAIAIIVCCLVAAAGITISTLSGGGGGPDPESRVQMLCVNEECEATFTLSRIEYTKLMMSQGMGPGAGYIVGTCPKCGEPSGFPALKCKKCGTVFIADTETEDYIDRCPECDYSPSEPKP